VRLVSSRSNQGSRSHHFYYDGQNSPARKNRRFTALVRGDHPTLVYTVSRPVVSGERYNTTRFSTGFGVHRRWLCRGRQRPRFQGDGRRAIRHIFYLYFKVSLSTPSFPGSIAIVKGGAGAPMRRGKHLALLPRSEADRRRDDGDQDRKDDV